MGDIDDLIDELDIRDELEQIAKKMNENWDKHGTKHISEMKDGDQHLKFMMKIYRTKGD